MPLSTSRSRRPKTAPPEFSEDRSLAFLILILGAGLGFVPEYRTKSFVEKKKEADQYPRDRQAIGCPHAQNLASARPLSSRSRNLSKQWPRLATN